MNWIKENSFLAGFIAVLIVGGGALGYLLYSAYDSYSDVSDQYNAQAAALHQLQVRVPYPDAQNLAKYKAERDDLIDATHSLADNLSKLVLPISEITPSAFQDRLRDTLSAVTQAAGQNGVKLPEKFTMDFEKYQTSPPAPAAAGPLARQLAALKLVMDILITERVDVITGMQRMPLPEEGGAAAAHPGPGEGQQKLVRGLVNRFPFAIKFTANQPAFQKVLNELAASNKQFFITRTLLVENTDPKPVAKQAAGVPTPAPAAAAPAGPSLVANPAAGGETPGGEGESRLKFIVGTEKVDVTMQLEMVAFNTPEKSTRKEAAPARPRP